MDAEQGTMGQGWPFETTLGAAPERGKSDGVAGRPVCRGKTFWLLLGQLPKVTRPRGRNQNDQAMQIIWLVAE